jgi:prepilin-type N-terminal cleavage/methylation domain-containing protein
MTLMRSINRLRTRTERGDQGFTMMEMVVTVLLFGMLSSVMTVFVSGVLRTTRHTNSQQYDLLNARNAMDAMTRTLRSAVDVNTSPVTPAFVSATPTSVSFYAANGTDNGALTNTGPTLVTYSINTTNNTLVEQSTPATTNAVGSATPYSWNSANMRTRVIASGVVNPQPARSDVTGPQTSGGPVFIYFDYSGAAVPVDGSGAVTTAGLPLIQQVEIWLTLRTGLASESGATTVNAQVQIVAGYDPDGGTH